MGIDFKDKTVQIFIKIVVFVLTGYILLGGQVVSINDSMLSFTIYGISAIFFYNAIKKWGLKDFIIPACIYSIVLIMTLMRMTLFATFIRNFIFFILLGAFAYYAVLLEKKQIVKEKAYFIPLYWFAGSLFLFLIVTILNTFVFGLYILSEYQTFPGYLFTDLKTGAVFGVGISIGILLQQFFDKKTVPDKKVVTKKRSGR